MLIIWNQFPLPINSIQFAFHFLPILYKLSSSENTIKLLINQQIRLKKPEVVCDYMKTQPCMQLTVLQTNLLQVESANVNLCVNWYKLVDLLNICLLNNIPNLCEVVWEILPCKQRFLSCMAFSVYEVVWVACLSCSWFIYV